MARLQQSLLLHNAQCARVIYSNAGTERGVETQNLYTVALLRTEVLASSHFHYAPTKPLDCSIHSNKNKKKQYYETREKCLFHLQWNNCSKPDRLHKQKCIREHRPYGCLNRDSRLKNTLPRLRHLEFRRRQDTEEKKISPGYQLEAHCAEKIDTLFGSSSVTVFRCSHCNFRHFVIRGPQERHLGNPFVNKCDKRKK